jgi:hypothetical protein
MWYTCIVSTARQPSTYLRRVEHMDKDVDRIRRITLGADTPGVTITAHGPGGWGRGSTIEEARTNMLRFAGITNAKKHAPVLTSVIYEVTFKTTLITAADGFRVEHPEPL